MTPAVVRLVMEVCAMRLDPSVPAETFVAHLEELLDIAHHEALIEALGTDAENLPPKGPSKHVKLGSHAELGQGTPAPSDPPSSSAKPPSKPPTNGPATRTPASASKPGPPARRPAMAYDDKVRLRSKYDALRERARAEGRQRLPDGALQGLADEFGCSLTTVKKVIYKQDGT